MAAPHMTRRTYAYVHITGPGSHETITEILGLKPTDAWNIGDLNPSNGQPRKFMAWNFRSGLDDTHCLEEHIRAVFLWFNVRSEEVRKLWLEYEITLQCVGRFPSSCGSGVHIDREVVRKAATFGMAVDFDHYFIGDPKMGPN